MKRADLSELLQTRFGMRLDGVQEGLAQKLEEQKELKLGKAMSLKFRPEKKLQYVKKEETKKEEVEIVKDKETKKTKKTEE